MIVDEHLASFERSLIAVRMMGGSIEEARNFLERIMIHEA